MLGSGGPRSAAILAVLKERGVDTVAYHLKSPDPAGSEYAFARLLCDALDIPFQRIMMDTGFLLNGSFPILMGILGDAGTSRSPLQPDQNTRSSTIRLSPVSDEWARGTGTAWLAPLLCNLLKMRHCCVAEGW